MASPSSLESGASGSRFGRPVVDEACLSGSESYRWRQVLTMVDSKATHPCEAHHLPWPVVESRGDADHHERHLCRLSGEDLFCRLPVLSFGRLPVCLALARDLLDHPVGHRLCLAGSLCHGGLEQKKVKTQYDFWWYILKLT